MSEPGCTDCGATGWLYYHTQDCPSDKHRFVNNGEAYQWSTSRELARVSPDGKVTIAPDLTPVERVQVAGHLRDAGVPIPPELSGESSFQDRLTAIERRLDLIEETLATLKRYS